MLGISRQWVLTSMCSRNFDVGFGVLMASLRVQENPGLMHRKKWGAFLEEKKLRFFSPKINAAHFVLWISPGLPWDIQLFFFLLQFYPFFIDKHHQKSRVHMFLYEKHFEAIENNAKVLWNGVFISNKTKCFADQFFFNRFNNYKSLFVSKLYKIAVVKALQKKERGSL